MFFCCFFVVGKLILQKSILACYAKTNEMSKFETLFTDNDKTQILKEFTEFDSKINSDNKSDKNFDLEINKITDNFEIKQKGFTAVPSSKNGDVKISKVGFSAALNQNNGNSLMSKKGFVRCTFTKKRCKFCATSWFHRCTKNKKR
jgi:hypothetical protein